MFIRCMFYVLAVFSGLVGGVGDGLLNRWAKNGGTLWWIVGGYLCWNIALTVFFAMLKSGYYLSQSAAVFGAVNGCVILGLGWFAFREQLSPVGWAGVSIIFIGLVLTEIGH